MKKGYGHFIEAFNAARSLLEVSKIAASGLKFQDIKPLVKYLDLSLQDLSKITFTAASKIRNWKATSKINSLASGHFFRMDRVLKKGIEIFGSEDNFKKWINTPNISLGTTPRELLLDPIGIELVQEALDALDFGNIM